MKNVGERPLADIPKELQLCLLRNACEKERRAECKTDDGMVLELHRTDQEKTQCAKNLLAWYKTQQAIHGRHPQSGKPANPPAVPTREKADWP